MIVAAIMLVVAFQLLAVALAKAADAGDHQVVVVVDWEREQWFDLEGFQAGNQKGLGHEAVQAVLELAAADA